MSFHIFLPLVKSRIAQWYGLDDRGNLPPQGLETFLFTTASRPALGPTQPPIQWVPGALSLEVKRPGREADHSPPTSAEVKNAWSYTSTPKYAFMAWCSVEAQGQPYLYLYVCYPARHTLKRMSGVLECRLPYQ
jgi:hypothetical protein